MLTTAAFNALLKTLEEPPAHVVFVLCTTDPQKIPETILSRCQRFDFHRIGNEDIVGRLRFICEQEGFAFDDDALEVVAKHARGGMRDALSTLEQLSVFGNGSVRAADARALLGEVSGTVLSRFSHALASRDVSTLFALVNEQVDAGEDLMDSRATSWRTFATCTWPMSPAHVPSSSRARRKRLPRLPRRLHCSRAATGCRACSWCSMTRRSRCAPLPICG